MATNRIVGPSEYKQISKKYKVTPKNFDQYFIRQGKNIVYRDQAVNPTTGTGDAAAGVAKEAKPQYEIFGNAIMDLLKQYQGIEKYPYAKQGFNAQQEQINRIQASPDQSMVGASPEQQNVVRSASASAVQPTVSGANEAGQTFASRLNTFGDILGQARGLQQQMEQSAQQAKADARTLINNAFATTGGSEFLNMNPKELAGLEKTAGLPKDYIHNTVQAIKAREEKLKQEELKSRAPQTMETSGGIFQWNPAAGKWEATGLRGYHPSSGGGGGGGSSGLSFISKDPAISAFASMIANGEMDINDVPAKYKGAVAQMIMQTTQEENIQPASLTQYLQQKSEFQGLNDSQIQRLLQGNPQGIPSQNLQQITSQLLNQYRQEYAQAQKPQEGMEQIFALNKGGKKPNVEYAVKPLQKAYSVIGQLGELQKSINQTITDPFIGTLKKVNPYDFDARSIQAQLQAIVPTLARGIYGEVGVLTDQDVKNYIKTLPNIQSTKQQNDFVMGMTLRVALRGYESQLETLAASGFDMSGFKNQYQKLKKTTEDIEKNIKIESAPSQSNQQTSGKTSSGLGYTIIP